MDAGQLAEMAGKCAFLLEGGEIKPLRWIRWARARHYRLYNACFEEYLMAENYYLAFMQTNNPVHLDNLMAVLYRRPWHWWNAEKIQVRAGMFSKKGSGKVNAREYVNGMIHALNNQDITLNKKLMKQPAWDALNELEQRALEAVKMKEAIDKNK